MSTVLKTFLLFIFALFLGSSIGLAADQVKDKGRDQLREQKIYGWQLMTQKERDQHREKMQKLKTEKEREEYRKTHHETMQARAREQGMTLPDMPQQRGKGMGQGGGMGSGGGGRRY